jgi:hypothetical protein
VGMKTLTDRQLQKALDLFKSLMKKVDGHKLYHMRNAGLIKAEAEANPCGVSERRPEGHIGPSFSAAWKRLYSQEDHEEWEKQAEEWRESLDATS